MRVVLLLAVSEGLMVGLILVCVRYIWGHAYSDVEEVVSYVARMMLVIAVTIFFDGIMTVLSGNSRLITKTFATAFLHSVHGKLFSSNWTVTGKIKHSRIMF